MPLTREMMRPAGSKAFKELKKYKFYESETEGSLTTVSLFGDTYQFFFDAERKMAWMNSKHHYKECHNFKLCTKHKDWEGIFSFPRSIVYESFMKSFREQDIKLNGVEENKRLGTECRIVVNQVYKADKHKMARIFGGFLWKHYNSELACMALKAFGLGASAFDYALIANNEEEIRDTLQKAPAILPIWRDLALAKIMGRSAKGREILAPSFDHENFHDHLSALGYFAQKFNPKDAESFSCPDIVKLVKDKLDNFGLTGAGWRYLLKLTPRIVSIILRSVGLTDLFTRLLNWFAEIGVVPRHSLVKPIMNNLSGMILTNDLTALMRVALTKASKMRTGVKTFFSGQMHFVLDWFQKAGIEHQVDRALSLTGGKGFARSHAVQLDPNQRKASWEWFMRQQREWHEAIDLAERLKLKARTEDNSWESALQEVVVKGYKIIPLTSSYELIDEGKDMHHCVGSYSENCLEGNSRIFSIRDKENNKIATLELRFTTYFSGKTQHGWVVNQCRGVCNGDVSAELKTVAEEVARKYNKAVEKFVPKEDKRAIAV